jgi:hypothetical protein
MPKNSFAIDLGYSEKDIVDKFGEDFLRTIKYRMPIKKENPPQTSTK